MLLKYPVGFMVILRPKNIQQSMLLIGSNLTVKITTYPDANEVDAKN